MPPGQTLSIPLVFYMPGSTALDDIQRHGELAWFSDTWRYRRALLGKLQIPANPWLAEFIERNCRKRWAASRWGRPANWPGRTGARIPPRGRFGPRIAYSRRLPLVSIEPRLAAAIVDWFHKNGVRHPGQIVEGGLNIPSPQRLQHFAGGEVL